MHDDGPQVILPAPAAPEKVAERVRAAKAILAESGLPGARVEDQGQTLLIQIVPTDLTRLQDEAFRHGLVARLRSLGYAFAAIDITPDDTVSVPPAAERDGGSCP